MHEGAIAESIVDILRQVKAENSINRVTKVRLKIGMMSGVMVDALLFALEALRTEESIIKETEFEVIQTHLRAKCNLCGKIYSYNDPTDIVMLCESCGMPLDIVEGKEMEIVDIEGD